MLAGVTSQVIVTVLTVNIALTTLAHSREEATLGHVITPEEARRAARHLLPELRDKIVAGCGVCTTEEVHYCLGDGVIRDHCCCDAHYLEPFPYVPHSCHLAPICSTITRDCEHYVRVRVCCCDRTISLHWKYLFSRSSQTSVTQWLLPTVIIIKLFLWN